MSADVPEPTESAAEKDLADPGVGSEVEPVRTGPGRGDCHRPHECGDDGEHQQVASETGPPASSEPEQGCRPDREEDVELFLDCQRPVVDEGTSLGELIAVGGALGDRPPVEDLEQRCDAVGTSGGGRAERVGTGAYDDDDGDHERCGRRQADEPPPPELDNANRAFVLGFGQQLGRDQETRQGEKRRHRQESTGEHVETAVVADHRHHEDSAQAVERRHVAEAFRRVSDALGGHSRSA